MNLFEQSMMGQQVIKELNFLDQSIEHNKKVIDELKLHSGGINDYKIAYLEVIILVTENYKKQLLEEFDIEEIH